MTQQHLQPKKILLVNDDGADANGFLFLKEFLTTKGYDVLSVVPSREMSCCSHSITFSEAMALCKIEESFFILAGTPVDCVIVGLELAKQTLAPDLVISGINNSQNIGREIFSSGTVAAAREAALHGIKSIAISIDIIEDSDKHLSQAYYSNACSILDTIINSTDKILWPKGAFLNLNIPKHLNAKAVETNPSRESFLERKVSLGEDLSSATISVLGQNTSKAETMDDIAALRDRNISFSFISTDHGYMKLDQPNFIASLIQYRLKAENGRL